MIADFHLSRSFLIRERLMNSIDANPRATPELTALRPRQDSRSSPTEKRLSDGAVPANRRQVAAS